MYQSGDQSGEGASTFHIRIDAAEASSGNPDTEPSILFPDKDILFTADFKRSGTDLLLVRHETTAVILDYFREDRRLSLITPEGASLSGATVEALAGPDPSGQYAQATPAVATRASIGRVEKVSGSATVLRNGVLIELRLGDLVAKGDVVQTGTSSSVAIKLNDGTVFSLSSNARMVLNDMVYAADSTANSALFTLVEGVIGFIAGKIAKTGDLKVDTPVATMAIRGTAVQTEIAASSGTTRFSLLTEPDGTVGSFLLLNKNDPSRVITSVSDTRTATLLTPVAAADPRITLVTKTADDLRGEGSFVRDMFQFFAPEPLQRRGSSDSEDTPVIPVNLFQQVDPPDLSQFAIAPFVPERVASRDIVLPSLAAVSARMQGRAIEDGPLARLGTLPEADTPTGATLPLVLVPTSLPPGVRYRDGSRSFSLDPSDPAYQHLGKGETETVTVDYILLNSDGRQVPASVSWTIAGVNDDPVAASDTISAVGEIGRTILEVRSNDRDVDGDALQIVRWTAPSEGSILRTSSGDLVFDPRDDFRALSAGQTATLSFTYAISDAQGGTDATTVTVKVQGTGTFSAPHQTDLERGILGFNQQEVSLIVDLPSATTTTSADLDLAIGLGPVLQPQMNILYLIDISGSTSEEFEGTPIGDLNRDGRANTVLDAELASLIALTERIRALGFSPADVTVTVIPFNGSADPTDATDRAEGGVDAATFGLGQAGDAAIENYLRGLDSRGLTNFADALRAANDRLEGLDEGSELNFVYFLSDGSGQGSIETELATLNGRYAAKITAVGVGEGARLTQLDMIDNTGGASLLTSPDQLDISVLGSPLEDGVVADLNVFLNGREIPEIDLEDLVRTPEGFTLNASLEGLERLAGDRNSLSATITFASGEALTTNLTIAGALPRSTDLIL
ncbi:FecR domain-containing protein [Microvirga sp. BT689]|uniref:Ig-like domain-containing protein n=1 Tax=Microvirga arvi TaxID=2778731 RepID=UPI0019520864|nr:Ig-like domain-containing protein [Microvirga arvi]MBM6580673.1 FecR domain-containing protein [Microvirga arvi]